MIIRGWLLDCYPSKRGMTFWMKTEGGDMIKLHDGTWRNRIYAHGDAADDLGFLKSRLLKTPASNFVSSVKFAYKRADLLQEGVQKVVEIELSQAGKARQVAETLEEIFQNPLTFQLYNVDVLPEQAYFYEKDIFPLGFLQVKTNGEQIVNWEMHDDVESVDYTIPDLKVLDMDIAISSKVPRFDSRLTGITLQNLEGSRKFERKSESAIIENALDEITRVDPDIIVTRNGDLFALPFLYLKAQKLGINFNLNRDSEMKASHLASVQAGGTTFFSYGRILFKAKMQKLYGRVHLDEANTFVFDQCRFAGLFELTRLCRMPLHNSVRASIGKCLSSIQFYYASKRDILIPWKPWVSEDPKTLRELLIQDRGGLVLEPLPGIHEHVGEIDFASLYPSIICKYNISSETLNCHCCRQGGHRIEGLDLHICEHQDGIVAKSLKLPLDKRFTYRRLRDATEDKLLKQIYNERAAALKWVLVCCLAKESSVLVEQNGLVEYVKIGELIDDIVGKKEGIIDCHVNMSVAGIGHDFKSKFCKIKKLIKIPNRQKLLNITLDDGRKITVTSDHPSYLLKNGNLEVKQATDLKEGNFIPVAKKLPSSVRNDEFIDVIDRLTKSLDDSELGRWRVSGSILSQILLENKQTVLQESMKQGYSDQSIRAWIKKGMVPLRFFGLLRVPLEMRKSLRIGIGRVKGKFGRTSWIPAIMPISEELGFFLGLYASDGSTTNTYIRLDIGYFETDLLDNTCKIVKSLFQTMPHIYKETNVNMYVVQINNLALVQFVERVLDIPNTSEKGKLKVPQIVFNSDRTVAQGFLEGMLAGDGSMSKARAFANIATASRDFANQIGFLAATLNLGFRLAVHTRARFSGNPIYSVNFVGPETLKTISQWKYLKRAHLAILGPKINNLCNENRNLNCTHPTYQLFPTDESGLVLLARQARTVRTPRIDRRDSACPYRISKTIERISASEKLYDEQSVTSFENVKRMFQGDLGFARIRKIEKLERIDDYVYCFQLEDDELPGFFTGDGAVFTHNCFGYLSYRNAKFGKIDSHIAVCGYARNTLFQAMRISENQDYRVVHGIVDSLWLSKSDATKEDYLELCDRIESETGFKIVLEGIYKWLVFLPSKIDSSNQVANRYFGCFEGSNEMKVRGVEYRRGDAPVYFKLCQKKIFDALSKCDNAQEARNAASTECVQIFHGFANRLEKHDVSPIELLITRRLSKNLEEYRSKRQLSVSASSKLAQEGLKLQAGQSVSYVISNYRTAGTNRAVPEELAENAKYDSERYIELLADCCATVLSPFGVTKQLLLLRSQQLL